MRYAPGTDVSERRDLRSAADVDFEESLGLARTQLVKFDGSVRDAIARLESQPGVAYAQPNYLYHAFAAAPNDTHFGHLWGLGATPGVGALPAWDRSLGAGQVIAVVDTGVDLTHPDLVPNLWSGPGGIHGHDFVDNDDVPDDFNLHGSHVAGTAAAVANNALGVAGVAPQAQIMAIRSLDAEGIGSTFTVVSGIAFAASSGAGVINLSFGGPAGGGDQAMSDAITLADAGGAVVVAAAGNGGDDGVGDNNDAAPITPCNLPNANLICVAAVTKTGARSDFSNFGSASVDLGAPGGDGSGDPNEDILSAKPAWANLFSENFETGFDGWTASGAGATWGPAGGGIDTDSATDSPGGNYQNNTNSQFQHTGINLGGQRGCRLDFFLRLNGVEDDVDVNGDPVDAVGVGVAASSLLGEEFAGDTGLFFERVEFAIPGADNQSDVKPTFTFRSDSSVVGDGAYVDDYNLLCRGSSYPNTIAGDGAADGGDYTAIAGTSMASPHVAGVAALVRAVDPGATPAQIVQALRNGAKPAAGMAGVTLTGGVVDAIGAMDASLAIPNPQPQPPPPTRPKRPSFSKVRVSRKGVVTLVVKGDAGNTGVLTLTANISAARVRNVGRKTFRIRSTGRATVKVKLKKPAFKQLKRKRKLKVKAKAVVKNAAGLTSSRTATLRLKPARRRQP